MAIREIRVVGDRVLTKKCRPVEKMTPRISELIDDMFDTMYEANGVGLAAPQVDPGDIRRTDRRRRMLKPSGKIRYSNPSELRKGKSTGPRHAAV